MRLDNKIAAVIVAAGESQRMGGVNKVLALLGGSPFWREQWGFSKLVAAE